MKSFGITEDGGFFGLQGIRVREVQFTLEHRSERNGHLNGPLTVRFEWELSGAVHDVVISTGFGKIM